MHQVIYNAFSADAPHHVVVYMLGSPAALVLVTRPLDHDLKHPIVYILNAFPAHCRVYTDHMHSGTTVVCGGA